MQACHVSNQLIRVPWNPFYFLNLQETHMALRHSYSTMLAALTRRAFGQNERLIASTVARKYAAQPAGRHSMELAV